ncbi:MAG: tetratricopeptide repeat protein [Gemmatimonadota bacterium]
MWLLVAHCLSRFADQPETARLDLAERCAQALEQFASTADEAVELDGVKPLDEASLGELRCMIDGLKKYGERAGQEGIGKAVLDMSTRIAALGALTLAHTIVGNARQAVPGASTRTLGLLLAEQARVLRLLGNLDDADALYGQLHAIGERSLDDVLLARAAIGRGGVARHRGNYPKSRAFYSDALALAERAGTADLQRLAHQGLTVAAATTEDWDEALRHGWLTLVLSAGNLANEAEALNNLAHISLGAGQPRAAMHAVLKALPNLVEDRTQLPALGTALLAAGYCDDRSMVEHLATRLEAAVAKTKLPYEASYSLLSLAEAMDQVGMAIRAETVRERALEIALTHSFHELVHRAESAKLTRRVTNEATSELEADSLHVVKNLEALEYELVV